MIQRSAIWNVITSVQRAFGLSQKEALVLRKQHSNIRWNAVLNLFPLLEQWTLYFMRNLTNLCANRKILTSTRSNLSIWASIISELQEENNHTPYLYSSWTSWNLLQKSDEKYFFSKQMKQNVVDAFCRLINSHIFLYLFS